MRSGNGQGGGLCIVPDRWTWTIPDYIGIAARTFTPEEQLDRELDRILDRRRLYLYRDLHTA